MTLRQSPLPGLCGAADRVPRARARGYCQAPLRGFRKTVRIGRGGGTMGGACTKHVRRMTMTDGDDIRLPARGKPWLGVLAFVVLLGAAGCVEERVVGSSWDRLAARMADRGLMVAIGDPDGARKAKRESLYDRQGVAEKPGWAILVKTFEGRKRAKDAEQFIEKLQQETNMPDLWSKEHKRTVYVYRGRYFDSEGFAARDELRQTRITQFEGERPFQKVELARVVQKRVELGKSGDVEVTAEMNLQRYVDQNFYSLQVGVYNDAFGKDYRRQAERCAGILRADGHKAFFFHKQYRSMVTVGLFTRGEAFVQVQIGGHLEDAYSPAVRELRETHRYNLLNGRTIIEKSGAKRIGEQPSFLVRF